MIAEILAFIYLYPVVVVTVLVITGIALWFFGYRTGNKDGHIEQHEQEMNKLCSYEGAVEFEVINRLNDRWLVTSILQRRGGGATVTNRHTAKPNPKLF